jgi:hypothetical protein
MPSSPESDAVVRGVGGIWGRDEPLEESRHVEFVSASSPPLLVQRHVERIDQIL